MILLTGGTGQLGSAIRAVAEKQGIELLAPSHQELNVLDPELRLLRGSRPVAVIHCAARTDNRACHDDPESAFAVNAVGALHVARACRDLDALMVLVSSDAVFDGRLRARPYTEEDIPHSPPSVYGATKLAAENVVIQTCRSLVVRVGWLFSEDPYRDPKLIGSLTRRAQAGKSVAVVSDKWGSPSFAPHVAQKLLSYSLDGLQGVRHIANAGVTTRYEFARVVLSGLGYVDVQPCTSRSFPDPVVRADYSGLATTYGDAVLPPWRAAVEEMLRGVRHRSSARPR